MTLAHVLKLGAETHFLSSSLELGSRCAGRIYEQYGLGSATWVRDPHRGRSLTIIDGLTMLES